MFPSIKDVYVFIWYLCLHSKLSTYVYVGGPMVFFPSQVQMCQMQKVRLCSATFSKELALVKLDLRIYHWDFSHEFILPWSTSWISWPIPAKQKIYKNTQMLWVLQLKLTRKQALSALKSSSSLSPRTEMRTPHWKSFPIHEQYWCNSLCDFINLCIYMGMNDPVFFLMMDSLSWNNIYHEIPTLCRSFVFRVIAWKGLLEGSWQLGRKALFQVTSKETWWDPSKVLKNENMLLVLCHGFKSHMGKVTNLSLLWCPDQPSNITFNRNLSGKGEHCVTT